MSAARTHALQPRHAVISVGYANRFGHPAAAVVERRAAAGAQVWRTDRHGLVEVRSDGETLSVRPFRQP